MEVDPLKAGIIKRIGARKLKVFSYARHRKRIGPLKTPPRLS
jgi:hypothetical protein